MLTVTNSSQTGTLDSSRARSRTLKLLLDAFHVLGAQDPVQVALQVLLELLLLAQLLELARPPRLVALLRELAACSTEVDPYCNGISGSERSAACVIQESANAMLSNRALHLFLSHFFSHTRCKR